MANLQLSRGSSGSPLLDALLAYMLVICMQGRPWRRRAALSSDGVTVRDIQFQNLQKPDVCRKDKITTMAVVPKKIGVRYHPPAIVLDYTLESSKRRRRIMPLRQFSPSKEYVTACVQGRAQPLLTRAFSIEDIVDELLDRHEDYLLEVPVRQVCS